MSFTKDLEKEINLYIKNLEDLKKLDMESINAVLDECARMVRDDIAKLKLKSAEYEKNINNCDEVINKLYERENVISDFLRSNKRKVMPFKFCPLSIKNIQSEIDHLVTEINEFEGMDFIDNKDIQYLKDNEALHFLAEEFKKRNDDILAEIKDITESPITAKLLGRFDNDYLVNASRNDAKEVELKDLEEKIGLIENYYALIKNLAVPLLSKEVYGNLMSVLSISLPDMPYAMECSGWLKGHGFSMECSEAFDRLISFNFNKSNDVDLDIFESIKDCEKIAYSEDGICLSDENNYRLKKKIVFSINFLKKLLALIKENPTANLPSFAMIINEHNCNEINILRKLSYFKELYEETPGQIVVRDNQYFKQKELEEIEYQAERDRRRRERQAEREAAREERYREQQLKIQRESEWAAQRQWEEDKHREDEQRKRDEDEARRLQRQQQREELDRRGNELKAQMEASARCVRCANHDKCGKSRGVINCGAFRPRY